MTVKWHTSFEKYFIYMHYTNKYLNSIQNDQNYCLKVKTLGKYAQVDVENTGWS